jgi:hypothetical protein
MADQAELLEDIARAAEGRKAADEALDAARARLADMPRLPTCSMPRTRDHYLYWGSAEIGTKTTEVAVGRT